MLLLLGGRDVPTGVPTMEVPYDHNNRVMRIIENILPIMWLFSYIRSCLLSSGYG